MTWGKEWYRRYVEGSIIEYVRGIKRGAHQRWAIGIIFSAINGGYLTKHETLDMIKHIEENPIILPFLSREEKRKRLEPLNQVLSSLGG